MTGAGGRRPLLVRGYAHLVALVLPARFRQEFGAEMVHVFTQLLDEAKRDGHRLSALRALLAELAPLVRLALRERAEERAERARFAALHAPHPEGRSMLDSFRQDLRYATRSLLRAPGFAIITVLTLALGIGANTAIFSVIDGVLLRPLPLHEPDRLLAIGEGVRGGSATDMSSTSSGSFFDWKRQARTVRIGGVSFGSATLTGIGEPERLQLANAIGGLFQVLGVQPMLGRTLAESDEDPASEQVVVLSHAAWRRLFGEDRGVLGRTITLNGTARTIVGVMPPDFRFPDATTEMWLPLRMDAERRANRDQYFIQAVGRLAPGATLDDARRELAQIAAGIRRDWPLYNNDLRILARPLHDTIVDGVRTRLFVVMGAVVVVLLIACANIANLMLARASARRREIAVRRALGAGRGRIARQLLTESLLLALAGGTAGVLAGKWLLELLLAAQATTNLPRVDDVTLDQRVLFFTLVISVGAGLFFGSFPAWQLTRPGSADVLREGARGSSGREWARSALVVAEVAMAMVLLTGAGLLLRSFASLQQVDPGFTADRVLTFDLALPSGNPTFAPTSLEQLRAIPGVQSAAIVSQFPVTGRGIGAWFNRIDRPVPSDQTPDAEAYRVVTPEYFEAIGLPLRRGRLLTQQDRRERPVVVINEALAKKHYPNEDPIGREIYLGAPDNRLFDRGTIVGVVGDTRDAGLGSDPLPIVYIPLAVMPSWPFASYVIRTQSPPADLAAAARDVIRTLDPALPVRNLRTLDTVLSDAVAPARWSGTLLGVFAAVALVMAALGVFGVLSFAVTQRTRELGIRLALGAAPRALRRMVVNRGLLLVGGGLVLGIAGALALSRVMTTLLHGVEATDPITYVAVVGILLGIATLASWLPARRATRIDPALALRVE